MSVGSYLQFYTSAFKVIDINDYQAECHTPEYHIGIDLIKPFRNPISSDPQNVRRSSRNRRS